MIGTIGRRGRVRPGPSSSDPPKAGRHMSFWDDAERREAARFRFELRMAIPVLVAAALLTAITLVLIFVELSQRARTMLVSVDLVIWAFFVFDYLVRFASA